MGAERGDTAPTTPIRAPSALTSSNLDAYVVLILWLIHRSFLWLLWLGLSVAAVVSGSSTIEADLDTPGSFWSGLASPVAVLVVAILVRIGASVAGLLATYPLVRAHDSELSEQSRGNLSLGLWSDRFYLARAYAALRWTYAVRRLAAEHLGTTGARLEGTDRVVGIANIVGFFVMLGVLLAVS